MTTTGRTRARGEPAQVDARALEAELARAVSGEVRFDEGSRGAYSTDASNYRQVPLGVVVPRTVEDVVATVGVCAELGAPITSRGGGTSLAGQTCNTGVILDWSKYLNRVLELDPVRRVARVQPGAVLDTLRDRAERHGLTFGPDPATHNRCTLGGMIGNNSCGVHSVMAGRTADNVEALEVLTSDGERAWLGRYDEPEIERAVARGGPAGARLGRLRALRDRVAGRVRQRFPDLPRRVSGYALEQLLPEHGFHVARSLVGSEGTCATVLEATVRLVHSPPARNLLVLGFPDVATAADHVPDVLAHGPTGLEGMDQRLIDNMLRKGMHTDYVPSLPEGRGWLLVEFGGDDPREADAKARRLMDELRRGSGPAPTARLLDDPREAHHVWVIRESGLGATAFVPGEADAWPGWEDSAVPRERLGDYLRDLGRLFDDYGYHPALYGHFGDGCVHCRIDFDLLTAPGVDAYRAFVEEAADLVVSHGGSLSGEHGDGQARGELLERMYGRELVDAFAEFKDIWDPLGLMNPGKVVPARPLDADLRLGADYAPPEVDTAFAFPGDGHSFARATQRCVGVGECRKRDGGVMCPSYMVTGEEEHSTRGRARLLFEMLQHDPVSGGWGSEAVKDALDLCLACKGCKGECPVNVDMATYKAEFLSHYHAEHRRPRSAWSMGLIPWTARAASAAPAAVNAVTHAPVLGGLVKRLGGVDPRRDAPWFAPTTFRRSFRRRGARGDGPRVLLWPDTFTNHFEPRVAAAATRVLETAGYAVAIPPRPLCCGRPLYDYGMLGLAERQLRRILDALRDDIRAGVPLVGLEPSCVSVFRDELRNLLPDDQDARRLASLARTLGEFLADEDAEVPPVDARAVVHGHCHHRSVLDFAADESVLRATGMDLDVLDSGCCGMAGSFGFEQGEHYDVAQACGERVLLPAVRDVPDGTLVVADGFSCREMIRQGTSRRPVHLAEVLAMGLARPERSDRCT